MLGGGFRCGSQGCTPHRQWRAQCRGRGCAGLGCAGWPRLLAARRRVVQWAQWAPMGDLGCVVGALRGIVAQLRETGCRGAIEDDLQGVVALPFECERRADGAWLGGCPGELHRDGGHWGDGEQGGDGDAMGWGAAEFLCMLRNVSSSCNILHTLYLVAVGGVVDEQTRGGRLANMGVAQIDPWCLVDGGNCVKQYDASYVAKGDEQEHGHIALCACCFHSDSR